ncbi:hypothetical protein BGZ54_002208, partial [Gamsiella multidivaricata]
MASTLPPAMSAPAPAPAPVPASSPTGVPSISAASAQTAPTIPNKKRAQRKPFNKNRIKDKDRQDND